MREIPRVHPIMIAQTHTHTHTRICNLTTLQASNPASQTHARSACIPHTSLKCNCGDHACTLCWCDSMACHLWLEFGCRPWCELDLDVGVFSLFQPSSPGSAIPTSYITFSSGRLHTRLVGIPTGGTPVFLGVTVGLGCVTGWVG